MRYPPTDKIAHMGGGFLLFLLFLPMGSLFGAAAAIAVGVWKEYQDYLDNMAAADMELPAPHEVSKLDAVWTGAPAVIAAIWLWVTMDVPLVATWIYDFVA